MSKYDLSKAQDFQRLTLGSAAGVLQTLSLLGRNPDLWDIQEGSYNGVLFHVFQSKTSYQAELPQIHDRGGRRKTKFKFPYRDGQTTDDLGREANSFDIEALFHGPRYMEGFKALLAELDKPTPGDLIHPVRGKIRCVPENHEILHSHEKNQALEIRITFIEHNFTIGDLRDLKDNSVKGALSAAIEALKTIDNVITNVIGAGLFVKSLRNQIKQALTDYSNNFGLTLSNLNRIFNNRGSGDIPGLLPVNQGGLLTPSGARSGNNFVSVLTQNQLLAQVQTTADLPTSVAVLKVTNDVSKLRTDVENIISSIKYGAKGQGSLEFFDDILSLRQTAVLMQDVLERGIASSRSQVIDYKTPRVMSLREVAFSNSISVNRVNELDQLNPSLDSVNFIEKDTIVRVPLS